MARLILSLASAAVVGFSAPVAAQTTFGKEAVVRQFVATAPESPRSLAERLAADLPPGVAPLAYGPDGYMLSYAGTAPPPSLIRFLTTRFEAIDEGDLSPLRDLNVSLHLSPEGEGTQVRAVILLPRTSASDNSARSFHQEVLGAPVPEGAEVILDGGTGGGIRDLVLAVHGRPSELSDRYVEIMKAAGFDISRQSMEDRALIFGSRPGTSAVVFIQADLEMRGRSLVVVRSLEE
jgi:hypothetical protein